MSNWHIFGPSTSDGRAQAICGQALSEEHGLTSELRKINCKLCFESEISRLSVLLDDIADVARGRRKVQTPETTSQEIKAAALRVASYQWGTSVSETFHFERVAAMDELRRLLALPAKPDQPTTINLPCPSCKASAAFVSDLMCYVCKSCHVFFNGVTRQIIHPTDQQSNSPVTGTVNSESPDSTKEQEGAK